MACPPYIPTAGEAFRTFLQTFVSGIAAAPARYGLGPGDAATLQNAFERFDAAFREAAAHRTPARTAIKAQMRASAERLLRHYAVRIKYNHGVSDADKIAIGVRPVNLARTPAASPTTNPLIWIIGALPGSHTLRYADANTPDRTGKPLGVTNIQIYRVIADEPATDPAQARFYAAFTRNPITIPFDHADNARTATYFARWCNPKGQVGPWSLPVSMTIAA